MQPPGIHDAPDRFRWFTPAHSLAKIGAALLLLHRKQTRLQFKYEA
jgi:hypothetical protein